MLWARLSAAFTLVCTPRRTSRTMVREMTGRQCVALAVVVGWLLSKADKPSLRKEFGRSANNFVVWSLRHTALLAYFAMHVSRARKRPKILVLVVLLPASYSSALPE